MMLERVKVVLVGTTHSGNIGSAARAMKVMGLSQMVLVDPQCQVDAQAIALAAGASEIALNAQIYPTLEAAVADCGLVVGTSARSRTLNGQCLSHASAEKNSSAKPTNIVWLWCLVVNVLA